MGLLGRIVLPYKYRFCNKYKFERDITTEITYTVLITTMCEIRFGFHSKIRVYSQSFVLKPYTPCKYHTGITLQYCQTYLRRRFCMKIILKTKHRYRRPHNNIIISQSYLNLDHRKIFLNLIQLSILSISYI